MYGNSSTIEINAKHYSKSNLCMLLGLGDSVSLKVLKKNKISKDILNIAQVMDDPSQLPVMIKQIYHIPREGNEEVRLVLVRAQIDAALRMNENLQKYMTQRYVAETIEKLIFGELLLDGKAKKDARKKKGSNNEDVNKGIGKKKPGKN